MDGLNRVMLIGNLGQDPELRHTQAGQAVLNLRLVTNESFLNRDNERQERTEWHTVTIWGKRGEGLNKILTKGMQLFIDGRLQTRSWEDKHGDDDRDDGAPDRSADRAVERRDTDRARERPASRAPGAGERALPTHLPDRGRTPIASADDARLKLWQQRCAEDIADDPPADRLAELRRLAHAIHAELEKRAQANDDVPF